MVVVLDFVLVLVLVSDLVFGLGLGLESQGRMFRRLNNRIRSWLLLCLNATRGLPRRVLLWVPPAHTRWHVRAASQTCLP